MSPRDVHRLPHDYHVCQRGLTPTDSARKEGRTALAEELENVRIAPSMCVIANRDSSFYLIEMASGFERGECRQPQIKAMRRSDDLFLTEPQTGWQSGWSEDACSK